MFSRLFYVEHKSDLMLPHERVAKPVFISWKFKSADCFSLLCGKQNQIIGKSHHNCNGRSC